MTLLPPPAAHPHAAHDRPRPGRARWAGLGVLAVRMLLAAVGGVGVYLSFAPHGLWPLGIVGMAVFLAAAAPWGGRPLSAGGGLVVGLAHGLALYLLLLPWVGEFVGAMPYVALAVTEALYSAGLGVLLARVLRLRWGLLMAPVVTVAVEWLRASWPFGGFGWGRISWGQADGPLVWAARVAGPTMITVLVVALAALVVLGVQALADWRRGARTAPTPLRRARRVTAGVLVGATALVLGVAHLPTPAPVGDVRVAAVQGNVPRMGLDFNAQRRAVLRNHVDATDSISTPVDFAVWPENASDVNPFRDAQAGAWVAGAARELQAPILVGTVTADAVGDRNTMVVFDADGRAGDYHYKKYLQPFGEYMPLRDFFRTISPLVDQAGNFQPGTGDGTVRLTGALIGREITVGVSTCYEVAFDGSAASAVAHGAEILTTPTNNATFGFTDMTYQQLAMSRVRAVEYDRAVIVAATSGVSALIDPSGTVLDHSEIFTQDVLTDTLPLKQGRTLAARAGSPIATSLDIIGLLCALGAWVATRRRGHHARPTPSDSPDTTD
ncbi:apolipoprotein N-acyltransferase [Corynebacterium sp. 13CS0277]|nr:apolipoprotein N-acyltransferase [Corynebacterium sp. 13CS0277]